MRSISDFWNNQDIATVQKLGAFSVLEHVKELSVSPLEAGMAYYRSKMNIRKRQLLCDLSVSDVTLQAGSMQWMAGDVDCSTDIRGVADLGKKFIKDKVTGKSTVKPVYSGDGFLCTEPTYKHLILMDLRQWGGSVVLEDGLFLACDADIKQSLSALINTPSAVLGQEGLFNLTLSGEGVFCLESPCPFAELVVITLDDDTLKINGNNAIAWSSDLKFTVETAGKNLIGSDPSGEGFVNTYSGTGRVMFKLV